MSKRLFLGGKGKIEFTAQLHRSTWIAGQRCYLDFKVLNDTRKAFKSLTLTLIRTTTLFKPHPFLDALPGRADPDACQTTTTSKPVATSTLEMARVGEKGHASAKGWWTGVNAKDEIDFSHYISLPVSGLIFLHAPQIFLYYFVEMDALSFNRVKLLEVKYTIRVSLNAGLLLGDVDVILPIRIVNFLSIDPPNSTLSGATEGNSRQNSIKSYSSTFSKEASFALNGRSASICTVNAEGAGYFAETCLPDLIRGSKSNFNPAEGSWPGPEYDMDRKSDDNHRRSDFEPQVDSEVDSDAVGCTGSKASIHYYPLTGPRAPAVAPRHSERRKNGPTSFDLLVQEKLRALGSGAEHVEVKSGNRSAGKVQQPTLDFLNEEYVKAGMKAATSPGEKFGTAPPSHKLPKPPIMTQKPIVRTCLTDPGPVPPPSSGVLDSSRGPAIFKRSHAQMALTSGETTGQE